ncbi:hypothetical protein Tco_0814568, partial [Tanacetum coccineum]
TSEGEENTSLNIEPMKNDRTKLNDLLKDVEHKITSLMKWHHLERNKDGKLRHPADGLAWKDFDEKNPEFATDPRNVRYNMPICLKDLDENDLRFLESRVAVTLCKLEKIFPPSFFIVMVHLVIHLVRQVRLGGPTPFHWMYPIERDLCTLKSYVNNKACPEGSIAEGYLARESLTFCSRYLCGVETLFTRPIRNDDDDNQNEIESSNFLCPGRPLGQHFHSELPSHKRKKSAAYEIDEKSLTQAHRYVLFNVDSITQFREEHKNIIKGKHRSRRIPQFELEKIHCEQFSEWFRKRVERLEELSDPRVTQEIKWLARGPNNFVRRYSGYFVKGCRFHTKNHENSLKSQNSGVVVTLLDSSNTQEVVSYYGSLKEVVKLNYSGKIRVVLFKCDWVDVNKGCKRDKFGITLVNFSHLTHSGSDIHDDPFVFASQVDKVFYAKDPRLHRNEVDGDDEIDVTESMEDEDEEEEDTY